jgi:hypothetical protein
MQVFKKKMKRRLDNLKAAFEKNGADALYASLRELYGQSWECGNSKIARTHMRALGGRPSNCEVEAFITGFLRRSVPDRKLRYKYGCALKLAEMKKKSPKHVKAFIKKRGGVNGCAQLYRTALKRKATATKN